MLLNIHNVSLSFGGIVALKNLSVELAAGEILGVIGPNGAGKTTFFNILTGVYTPDTGDVLLEGKSIKKLKPHQICRQGVARTFQNIRLFSRLTVFQNVLAATYQHMPLSLRAAVWRGPRFQAEEKKLADLAHHFLGLFGLDDKKDELASNLSYGDQRRLEIVRALATEPQILLLDEPAAGMNLTEKKNLIGLIERVQREHHQAVILIEHDMAVVMNLCPRIVVLDYGEKLAEGTPDEIKKNPKVIEAYLGTSV